MLPQGDYAPIIAAIVGAVLGGAIQATFKVVERIWHNAPDVPEAVQGKDAELWRYMMEIVRERDVEIHELRKFIDASRSGQTQTERREPDDTH